MKNGIAGVGDGGVEGIEQPDLSVGFAEQQQSGVGGDRAAGKLGDELPTAGAGKGEGVPITLCHRGGSRRGEGVVW